MKEELNNSEDPQKNPKKEKTTTEKISYSINYTITKTDEDIDLDFDLSNLFEDHLFAYAVVMADLMNVLETCKGSNVPEGFTEDLEITIRLLKTSLDAHQLGVEKKLGVYNEKHDILNKIMQEKQKYDDMINKMREKFRETLMNNNYEIQSVSVKSEDVKSDEDLEKLAEKILKGMPKNININTADFVLGGDLPEDISERLEKILRKKIEEYRQNSDDIEQDIEI